MMTYRCLHNDSITSGLRCNKLLDSNQNLFNGDIVTLDLVSIRTYYSYLLNKII